MATDTQNTNENNLNETAASADIMDSNADAQLSEDIQSVEAEEIEEVSETEQEPEAPQPTEKANQADHTLKAQVQEANDRYLRLMADFENYKRRMSAERIQLMQSAAKDLIIELLPVMDDLERGLEAAGTPEPNSPAEAIAKGVQLIHHKLLHSLKSRGLSPLEATSKPFDAELHEAIGQAPGKNGEVIAEVEKGYSLNGQVIRHSKVIVGAE